jgi:signal transduction histidine kinase
MQSRNTSWGRLFVLEQDPGDQSPQTQRTGCAPAGERAAAAVGLADDMEWVDAQLSRFDLLLRTLAPVDALARLLLNELAPLVGAARGAIYVMAVGAGARETKRLSLAASYAAGAGLPESVLVGEGLLGQCAIDRRMRIIRDVPEDHFRIHSALGSSAPRQLVVLPVWLDDANIAVLELAFFASLPASTEALLDRLSERRPGRSAFESAPEGAPSGGAAPHPRTRPSQRAGFWGKLSHELRSPLNSVLVLSKLLSENGESNLTAKQVAFAKAIHHSGNDLLGLVNAISDLSKIEAHRLVLEPVEMSFSHFRADLLRAFEPVAAARGLEFSVELEPGLPDSIVTDAKRLRQITKCLLSNAFKFTESGRVAVRVAMRGSGWSPTRERLNGARGVVAFAVTDTGVGMSESEQRSILEVFPPERIEARRGAGASGLGMAISRELARLLGGDLRVESVVGSGSTFTLYLPTCGLSTAATTEPAEESEAQAHADVAQATPEPPSELSAPVALPSPVSPAIGRASEPSSRRRPRGKGFEPAEPADMTALSGLNIILVDDDVRSAFALTGLLERQGAAVSHAEDVGEAIERLDEGRRTSALLIDAELLAAGSADSVRNMLQRCAHLPIIALTGTRTSEMPAQVHRLPKSVDARQLITLLCDMSTQGRPLSTGPIQS